MINEKKNEKEKKMRSKQEFNLEMKEKLKKILSFYWISKEKSNYYENQKFVSHILFLNV